MEENIFMKEKKQISFEDYLEYDESSRENLGGELPVIVYRLLEYSWFREIVSQNTYTATLPDGSTQTWQNTNTFPDPASEYYNENVCGIKTGSLSDDYNLIVLYRQHNKEFLICSLGSQSDTSRYDDVDFILKTIDESYYLTQ